MGTRKNRSEGILLSVKPHWANALIDGIKTVELRKKFPTNLPAGTRMYIYSSSPEKKVIGHCEIETVEVLNIDLLWKQTMSESMISWEDFQSYFSKTREGVAITVRKPQRYRTELSLSSFSGAQLTAPPQSFQYVRSESKGTSIAAQDRPQILARH